MVGDNHNGEVVFHSNLNGGGSANDGFDVEYRIQYSFSAETPSSMCSHDESLTIDAGETRIYPEFPIEGSVDAEGCVYTITSTDPNLDSIWLHFHEFNLTSEELGDVLEIYDFDPSSDTETLMATITNETFSRTNWRVRSCLCLVCEFS